MREVALATGPISASGLGPASERPAGVPGEPVAVVAERVGQAREVERVGERVGARGALGHRRLVEHAQTLHALQPRSRVQRPLETASCSATKRPWADWLISPRASAVESARR